MAHTALDIGIFDRMGYIVDAMVRGQYEFGPVADEVGDANAIFFDPEILASTKPRQEAVAQFLNALIYDMSDRHDVDLHAGFQVFEDGGEVYTAFMGTPDNAPLDMGVLWQHMGAYQEFLKAKIPPAHFEGRFDRDTELVLGPVPMETIETAFSCFGLLLAYKHDRAFEDVIKAPEEYDLVKAVWPLDGMQSGEKAIVLHRQAYLSLFENELTFNPLAAQAAQGEGAYPFARGPMN